MKGISLHQECRKKTVQKFKLEKKKNIKVQNVYSEYDLRSQCLETFMSYSSAYAIGDMVYLY
jgi:hypothetical protein